ncbi:MAG: hypothetical protein RL651_724 [Pseudomonadota bacterium]|jgi:hypothetical protein
MSENSLKNIGVKFAESKQSRSQESLNNLIEAAEKIVESGDASNLNARQLSKISGYSLGSLVQRLGKVENVFLHTIAYGREKHIKACCAQAEAFDVNKTASEFAEFMVNLSIDTINNIVGPSIVRYYESRALGRVSTIGDIHAYTDEIIPTVMKVSENNKTGTFRQLSLYEAKYVARAIFLFIERPFVENDPLAGSEEHRRTASRHVASLISIAK